MNTNPSIELTFISKVRFLSIFALFFLTSCYNYKPAYINSPKFEKQGQLNADVNIGSSFGGNLSYSPLKHWAVMANYSVDSDKFNGENEKDTMINQNGQLTQHYHYKNYFLEGAVGIYWNYDKDVYQDFYVGFGKGVASKVNPVFSEFSNEGIVAFQNDFQNLFLQSSIRFKVNEMLDIGIHGRINFLSYSNFKYVYRDYLSYPQGKEELNLYFWDRERIAYQLGLSAIVKLEHFNLYYQFQLGIPEYNYQRDSKFYNVRTFNSFIGISVPLNQFWKD